MEKIKRGKHEGLLQEWCTGAHMHFAAQAILNCQADKQFQKDDRSL